jgi:hypothetical protein
MNIIQTFPGAHWSARAVWLPLPPGLITADFLLLRDASLFKCLAPTPTTNLQTFEEQQVRSAAAVPKESMGQKDAVCIMRAWAWNRTVQNWRMHWEKVLGSIFIALFIFWM